MHNKYDELLIQGLTKLMELEFSHVSEIRNVDYIFSNKYKRNKDKLIKNLGHSYWKFINTAAKKVAVIVVALIIAFSSLMTVDAFRKKIVDFAYEVYKTFTTIYSYKDSSVYLEKNYSLKVIPTGYNFSIFNDYKKLKTIMWHNEYNEMIILTQANPLKSHHFNTEYGELNETIINDTPCLICKTNTDYFCYWEFDGYRFELIYPTDLGKEFMSEVVGNLVEIDLEELES